MDIASILAQDYKLAISWQDSLPAAPSLNGQPNVLRQTVHINERALCMVIPIRVDSEGHRHHPMYGCGNTSDLNNIDDLNDSSIGVPNIDFSPLC